MYNILNAVFNIFFRIEDTIQLSLKHNCSRPENNNIKLSYIIETELIDTTNSSYLNVYLLRTCHVKVIAFFVTLTSHQFSICVKSYDRIDVVLFNLFIMSDNEVFTYDN